MSKEPTKAEKERVSAIVEQMDDEGKLYGHSSKEIKSLAEIVVEQMQLIDENWNMCKLRHYNEKVYPKYKCIYEKLYYRCITKPEQKPAQTVKTTPEKHTAEIPAKRTHQQATEQTTEAVKEPALTESDNDEESFENTSKRPKLIHVAENKEPTPSPALVQQDQAVLAVLNIIQHFGLEELNIARIQNNEMRLILQDMVQETERITALQKTVADAQTAYFVAL